MRSLEAGLLCFEGLIRMKVVGRGEARLGCGVSHAIQDNLRLYSEHH